MHTKEELQDKIKEIIKKLADRNPCGEGKINLLNRRYVLMSTDYFPYDLTRDLEEIFNAAGDTILYKGGKRIGRDLYEHYIHIARKHGIDIWDVIEAVGWYFGWGTGEVVERGENDGVYRIIVYDSFESESFLSREGKSESHVCHFMRGVLTGIVEGVEGKEYHGKEVKCKATGDEYCEFVIEHK